MIITYYYVDYYVIITSLLRTIIVIMSPLLRIITVIMSPLLRVITVIMSPLLHIITRSIIRNNGLIITYYGPEQLADDCHHRATVKQQEKNRNIKPVDDNHAMF